MWLLYGLFMVVVVERVTGQNGPHVPENGIPVNAEGQLYAAKEVGNQEPVMGAATGYSTRYGGQSNHNSGYGGSYGDNNNNNYGGGYNSNNNNYGGSGYDAGYNNAGCYGRQPGMYGDASYDCKTFQVCQADGRLDTLYCPPYTRFNNYLGVCDWHFKVDSYCNPLYKEEYNNNNNYNSNNNYDSSSYNSNNYGSGYDNKGSNYNSHGSGSTYNGAYSSNVPAGTNTYNSGYRTPVYGLDGKY